MTLVRQQQPGKLAHEFVSATRRSGGSRGDRSVRFRVADSQDSLPSASSAGGASDGLSWLVPAAGSDGAASREVSLTASRQGMQPDRPASSRGSLDSRSRRGWPRVLADKPEATPVRSSGTFTRDEEGSFRPVLPALIDRMSAFATTGGTSAIAPPCVSISSLPLELA